MSTSTWVTAGSNTHDIIFLAFSTAGILLARRLDERSLQLSEQLHRTHAVATQWPGARGATCNVRQTRRSDHTGFLSACKVNLMTHESPRGSHHMNSESEIRFLFSTQSLSDNQSFSFQNDREFIMNEPRPRRGPWSARAYLLKKMMKKVLKEGTGADALRGTTCSAHISG